ncbi:MAG: Stage sporulation family protein [Actinomycetia bacterium]|nr:Stage sporulation family protein [Actinomycetes bacterium]
MRVTAGFVALLAVAVGAAITASFDGSGGTRAVVLVAVPAVALVAGLALALLLRRRMAQGFAEPIETLTVALRSVADGDFGGIVVVDGASEVVDASVAAQAATRRIARELASTARARAALEHTGPAIDLIRRELQAEVEPRPPGFAFAAYFDAGIGSMAGDFYDVVALPGNRAGVVLADVSGRGLSAGALAVRVKFLARAALQLSMTPGQSLDWIAEQLGDISPRSVACFVAVIDPATNVIAFANAGYPPPIVFAAKQEIALGATGPSVGALSGSWRTKQLRVGAGATVLLYSDEAARSAENPTIVDEAAVERLRSAVREHRTATADAIVLECAAAIAPAVPGRRTDDLTLAVIQLDRARDRPAPPPQEPAETEPLQNGRTPAT